MARRKISALCIGDLLKDDVFHLESLQKCGSAGYFCKFSDKTGELRGFISAERFKDGLADLVGGPVKVKGPILTDKELLPLVKVKALEKAEKGSFDEAELYDGLTREGIAKYLGIIAECKKVVKDEELSRLVSTLLTDETLELLSKMPASLKFHGKFEGGALAATACATKMALQEAASYIKNGNGLYTLTIDWSLLATAGLLHAVAIPEFYTRERPFSKTVVGVQRGYMSLLEGKILSAAAGIGLDSQDIRLAKVLNALACSVPTKSVIRATGPEGKIFRAALGTYSELDMLAEGLSDTDFSDKPYEYRKGVGYLFPVPGGKEGEAA